LTLARIAIFRLAICLALCIAGADSGAAGMRDMSSLQLAGRMGPGWNLGNSLEAIGRQPYAWGSTDFAETAWGNPKASQALFDAVRAAGFRSVRIPVAWSAYADADDNISPQWLARVSEVAGYARKAGLYAIINIHWDGGWMQPTYARQKAVNARLAKFWTQIATHFRNADDTLLFAGTNEVMADGDYGPPTAEYCAVQNSFNQTFVDAVRATGGNNARRHLVVQAFNTNIDSAVSCNASLPRDPAPERLMMEVHYYDPYDFALDEKSGVWTWGAAANPAGRGNEPYVEAQFRKLRTTFIDRGVPVILGEYGAIARTEFDPSGTNRGNWDQYITHAALSNGMVPIYWDNGYLSNHQFGLFDRASGAQAFPNLVSAIVNAGQ